MKRILFLSVLMSVPCVINTIFASITPSIPAVVTDNEQYVKVYIQKIHNGAGECSLNGVPLPADKALKPVRPVLIPFISIGSYLKEYTSRAPYTPHQALKIETPYGQFRLWASESGVMYAQDPQNEHSSIDRWKAKKLLGITRDEHGGKKLYIASLVLKAIKENKLKMVLEPLR